METRHCDTLKVLVDCTVRGAGLGQAIYAFNVGVTAGILVHRLRAAMEGRCVLCNAHRFPYVRVLKETTIYRHVLRIFLLGPFHKTCARPITREEGSVESSSRYNCTGDYKSLRSLSS